MPLRIGRYVVFDAIASGGMATVHLGRMTGPLGFTRTIAVKRLHPELARDGDLALMLLDEARVSARIQHPYVVQTLDVVCEQGDVLVILEYVHGESLAKLHRRAKERGARVDPRIAVTLIVQVLHGLHAAHEVTDEAGAALGVVHRDVSPQNVLVGADGVARVLDFGVAKAIGRAQTTREGQIKGKLAYMSPEQLQAEPVDRRTDVFAASIVLWELLTGQRLFGGEDEKTTIGKVFACDVAAPSSLVEGLDPPLDRVVLKGLARSPSDRYATAAEMAKALEAWAPAVPASQIADWVESLCGEELAARRELLANLERTTTADSATAEAPRQDELTKSAHSLPSETPKPPPTRQKWRLWAAISAALISALVFIYWRSAALNTSSSSDLRDARDAASAIASTKGPEVLPLATAPPAVTAEVTASPTSLPEPKPSATSPKAVRPTTKAPAKPDCSNPYVLDAQGHKRYRRECLGDP